jgi:hypothetical protein
MLFNPKNKVDYVEYLKTSHSKHASLILFNAHNRLIESSLQNNLHIFEAFAHGSLFIAP